jgi:beta-N-acetylhexosaminidase
VSVLNSPDHRALALDVARRAVTLQRDAQHLLPVSAADRVLVVTPEVPTRSLVQDDQLSSNLTDAVRTFAPSAASASSSTTATNAARNADVIVLATYDLVLDPDQQALVRALAATGKPVIGVGLRGPYDAAAAPEVGTFLTVYGDRPIHLQAAAEALFGKLTPSAKAP